MPIAIEQLDMRGYDLVISSSYAVSKGVLTAADQPHICYCYSPIRYAWDMHHYYLQEMKGIKRLLASWILHKMRLWDVLSSNRVDAFAAISQFVAQRIQKTYKCQAEVIYPPVFIDQFSLREEKEDFYITVSRLVPYKRVDLIVEAFREMPSKKLYVIGDGPLRKKIATGAPPNVVFLGHQPFDKLKDYVSRARAFLFAAIEDFGIAPLEAQACGTPVIAYGRGGVAETHRGLNAEHPTACFFFEQTPKAIRDAVEIFEQHEGLISPHSCRQNAERFSTAIFQEKFLKFVERHT